MFYGPDRLPELVGREPKIGLTVKLPAGGCGSCPARMCASCPLRSAAIKSEPSISKAKLGELTTFGTVETKMRLAGSPSFRPGDETVRLVSSEKTCPICDKDSTKTCPHSTRYHQAA